MVKQVVVFSWCDVCKSNDVETEPEWEGTLTIEDVTRTLELCGGHKNEIIETFKAILENYGTIPARKEKPSRAQDVTPTLQEGVRCPVCEEFLANRRSLQGHTRAVHQKALGTLEREARGEPGEKKFGPCGETNPDGSICDFMSSAPQGLGAHRRHVHDLRRVPQPTLE